MTNAARTIRTRKGTGPGVILPGFSSFTCGSGVNRLCSAPTAQQFTLLKRRICVLQNLLLVGDYKLGYVVAAHAVNCSGCARPYRIGIATRMLGGHGYGPIGTADDSALVVKGIGVAEIKDESCVL